jgi:hypothetical protein
MGVSFHTRPICGYAGRLDTIPYPRALGKSKPPAELSASLWGSEMNVLAVCDLAFGNTERASYSVARAVGGSTLRAAELTPAHGSALDLLILGSPTHGGFPAPGIDALLKVSAFLSGAKAAAFDTRT